MLNVVVMNVVAPFALSLASFAGLSNTWWYGLGVYPLRHCIALLLTRFQIN
jgi:hypothetical protein